MASQLQGVGAGHGATAEDSVAQESVTDDSVVTDSSVKGPESAELDRLIDKARTHLLRGQKPDGHWCAELEGDNILESEYVMLLCFLGGGVPRKTDEVRVRRACEHLRLSQLDSGGWSIYPGGPVDPNPTVKSYFALKLAGDDPEAPHMQKARQAAQACGGVEACNSFTKLFLCVFGQYAWADAPAVPPELIRMPLWFPINIWEMSSWSRAIVVPLAIVWALKPSCEVPNGRGIAELKVGSRRPQRPRLRSIGSVRAAVWAAVFRVVDRAIKLAEGLGFFRPWRRGSIEACMKWIEPRLEKSAGLAAIFPSILNVVVAYRALGFDETHPVIRSQLHELEKLEISDGDALKVQPCCSPVWDTSLTMSALLEAGVSAQHPALARAGEWLLAHEVKEPGDWLIKNPEGPIGGWYFEYQNEFYPDCDDTAEILAVFARVRYEDPALEKRKRAAVDRGLAWQLSMQNRDGGWGAFDRECNRDLLTLIPFADHNAMIDPSTADVTSRTIEALRAQGLPKNHEAITRALRFLEREQEEDGAWYGRWGANYLYGTWLAMCAFSSVGSYAFGQTPSKPSRRGAEWLLGCQNEDGGWGESLVSYDDPRLKGVGESTAAQTAWAMMGLLAAGAAPLDCTTGDQLADRACTALRRGASFLARTQEHDGTWNDEAWTGTGFPSVFYLRYHAYAHYFPLQALASYRKALTRRVSLGDETKPTGPGSDLSEELIA